MNIRKVNVGDVFQRLTVIKFTEKTFYNQRRKKAICKCECGNITEVMPSKLKSGHTKSCGCLKIGNKGNTVHGLGATPIHKLWSSIKSRCKPNSKSKRAKSYRDRGISVCKEWSENFLNFYNWAIQNGYEKGLHLDRIDPSGNYEPSNCQFISQTENLQKVKEDRRTKLQLLDYINYLEVLLKNNNIKYKKL